MTRKDLFILRKLVLKIVPFAVFRIHKSSMAVEVIDGRLSEQELREIVEKSLKGLSSLKSAYVEARTRYIPYPANVKVVSVHILPRSSDGK